MTRCREPCKPVPDRDAVGAKPALPSLLTSPQNPKGETIDVVEVGSDQERSSVVLLVVTAAVAFAIGALGAIAVTHRSPGPEVRAASETRAPDGGIVYVCGSEAVVAIHAHGLDAAEQIEVMLPLRGDGVLLPVTTGGATVMVGALVDHQYFQPQQGVLALTATIRRPPPTQQMLPARVGDRELLLPLESCSGG